MNRDRRYHVDELWCIKGEFYDLTNDSGFMLTHKGGMEKLMLGRGSRQDCVNLMESYHRLSDQNIYAILKSNSKLQPINKEWIDGLDLMIVQPTFDWSSPFHTEMTCRVKQYFKSHDLSPKAPLIFWLVYGPIALFSMYISYVTLIELNDPLLASIASALMMCMGFAWFHTGSHNALSDYYMVNEGVVLIWCTPMLWLKFFWQVHHVDWHHIFTGILDFDSDVTIVDVLFRKCKEMGYLWNHRFQKFYFTFTMTVFPGQWTSQSWAYIKASFGATLFDRRVAMQNLSSFTLDLLSIIVHLTLFWIYPSYKFGFSNCCITTLTFYIVESTVYYILVFPDHDVDVCEIKTIDTYNKDWSKQQIQSSASFKLPFWVEQLTGGISNQRAHHVFPGVHPWHYHDLDETIIKPLCREHNVGYHEFNNWFTAASSHRNMLDKYSVDPNNQNKDKIKLI